MPNQEDTGLKKVLNEVLTELASQEAKFPNQKHDVADWYCILGEELGEMAEEAVDSQEWRKEAIQCAAVLVRMIASVPEMAEAPAVHPNQVINRKDIHRLYASLGYACRRHMQTFYGQS